MSEPSAYEQYALELINAQRLNPQSAADLYGTALNSGLPAGTISAAQQQPLVFDPALGQVAKDYSQWMLTTSDPAAPLAHDDTWGTDKVTTINLDVLSNDISTGTFDPASLVVSNQSWNISKNNKPELSIKPDGTIDFDPRGAKGTFTFNYSITDSTGQTTTATAKVVVANTDKTAAAADTYQTGANEPLSLLGLLENDFYTEPDSQTTIKIKELPTNGDLFLNGALVIVDQVIPVTSLDNLVYRPTSGYSGNDQFLYELDSDGKSKAFVNISVLPPASTIEFTGDFASGENSTLLGTTDVLDPLLTLEDRLARLYESALHRTNTFDPQFGEIGLSYELGQYGQYNAGVLTENFAGSGNDKYITGVVYTDTDANDQFSFNEGVGGATIRIQPQGGSQEEFTNYATGGYAAATTASGLIDVEFSQNGTTVVATIEMGVDNVKVDLRDTNFIASSVSAFLGDGAVGLELLGINDTFATGNDGANIIIGNAGDNRIAGGEASDILTGNGGNDTFVFDNCHDGIDEVTDFLSGTDIIEIGRLGFAQSMQLGQLGEDSLVFGTTATQNQAQFLYDQSTGNLSIDMDGTGFGEALVFANLGAGTSLVASDIVITTGGRAHSITGENIIVIENNGAYQLAVDLNGRYQISNGVGMEITLAQGGFDVGPARYAGWSALQAEATATGYTVLWQGPNGVYSLWQTDSTGTHLSSQAMSAAELPLIEPDFQADIDGDGKIGVAETIEENGAHQLTVNATNAYQIGDGLSAPITLIHGDAEVGPAAYAGWYALQAEATEIGYTVLWQDSNGDYSLWQTDATGAYQTSRAVMTAELPGLETVFAADLDGDGQIGVPNLVEDNGSFQLTVNQDNAYEIRDGLGTQVTLSQGGLNVGPARYAGWSALQVEATDTGYTVLWQDPNGGYTLWQTDANGAYQTSKAVTSAALPGLEPEFAADLDGDGQIGVPNLVENNGSYQLTINQDNAYEIHDGLGTQITLSQGGLDVGPARYAGWSALQVEATDSGFTVLWQDPNGGYALWQMDATGAYQTSQTISAAALPGLETTFSADLDNSGKIGFPDVIDDNGSYQLTVNQNNHYEISDGLGTEIILSQGGVEVGPTRYAGWSALQVEATDTGFTVLWQDPNGGYALWQTDASGVYLSSRPISEAALPGLETIFSADLDGSGKIGLTDVIEDNGVYELSVSPANTYEISDDLGTQITLSQGGLDVGPTRYAGWSALQAEAKNDGFAVLWQDPNGAYSVWQTNAEGEYQGAYALQPGNLVEIEALFATDLDGDGSIGLV